MAWIESHQSLATHRKTWALARLLGVSIPTAIGHLHLLWWWALDNAPDGSLEGVTTEDLARCCQYRGSKGKLLDALAQAGFVSGTPPQLHDWKDYAGKLITMRETNAEKQRRHRARNRDITVTSPVTLPSRNGATVPTQPTVPTITPISPLVVSAFEKHIGVISAFAVDSLKDMVSQYPEAWVLAAMQKAKGKNLAYADSILKRWATQGGPDKGGSKPSDGAVDFWENPYGLTKEQYPDYGDFCRAVENERAKQKGPGHQHPGP